MTLILIALGLSAPALWAVVRAQARAVAVGEPIRWVPDGRRPMHPRF